MRHEIRSTKFLVIKFSGKVAINLRNIPFYDDGGKSIITKNMSCQEIEKLLDRDDISYALEDVVKIENSLHSEGCIENLGYIQDLDTSKNIFRKSNISS